MRRRFEVLLAAVAALVAMAGATAAQTAASVIQCNGGAPKACKGTPAKDTITGSGRADKIFAFGSPDSVDCNGGDDLVLGARATTSLAREGAWKAGQETTRSRANATTRYRIR